MEIKYEAVFGPQELFNGMMADCEFASEEYGYMFANGVLYYCERYNEKAGWALSCKSHLTFKPSSMRRIIRTPTWTAADKKAGRLPEVGSLVMVEEVEAENNIFEFAGVCAGSKRFAVKDIADGLLYFYSKEMIVPIETPEEKAARLREEWCSDALGSASILSGMKEYELKRLGGYVGNIYDALLSGELPVPGKGE